MKQRIYLASSLHSEEIRNKNVQIAEVLESNGMYTCKLPQRWGVWEPMMKEVKDRKRNISDEDALTAAKQYCHMMDRIDMELCNICILYCPKIPSEGAVYEAAYMYAKGKRVYILCDDDDVYSEVNLMLTYSWPRIRTPEEFLEIPFEPLETVYMLYTQSSMVDEENILMRYLLSHNYEPIAVYIGDKVDAIDTKYLRQFNLSIIEIHTPMYQIDSIYADISRIVFLDGEVPEAYKIAYAGVYMEKLKAIASCIDSELLMPFADKLCTYNDIVELGYKLGYNLGSSGINENIIWSLDYE